MTPEELKIIEERCNKATPGPWRACQEGTCSCSQIWSQSADVPVAEVTRGEWGDPGLPYGEIPEKIAEANSLFIAYAREDTPKLLEYVEELESRLPRWISVGERLPVDGEKVLVYTPGLGMVVLRFELDGSETITPWGTGFYNIECVWVEGVTHWMPLPKGPEE